MRNSVKIGIAVCLSMMILFTTIFLIRSTRPFLQAEKEAAELAQRYADVDEVTSFYQFTRKETYFTIIGKDSSGKKLVVIIPKDGKKISVYNQSDGISESKARQVIREKYPSAAITKVSLGLYDDQPVWEVVCKTNKGQLNYYLLAFKTGKIVNKIQNI